MNSNNQKNITKTDNIRSVLDSALKFNREKRAQGKDEVQNILLIGDTGSGKSSIVGEWAAENKLNVYRVFSQWQISARYLETMAYERLNEPNTILFIDGLDRAPKRARAKLLELVKTHEVFDPEAPGKKKKVENILFTIATAYPDSPAYKKNKLEQEELVCFKQVEVVMTPQVLLNHLTKRFNEYLQEDTDPVDIEADKGCLALTKAILTNKNFKFDTTEEISKLPKDDIYEKPLTYKGLTEALVFSRGSKKELFMVLPSSVGDHSMPMFEEILKDYHDRKEHMRDLVVITGGNSGLGLELARLFSKDYVVLVIARTKKTELKDVSYEYGNIADEAFLKGLYTKISNCNIKYLINNAAVGWFGSPEENTLDKVQKVFEGGLVGTILNTTYALPLMKEKGGKIINILSTAALRGNANESLYCAAKWGVRGYTESLKTTYKNTNIKVVSVCQGGMNTSFWDENRDYVPKEKSNGWMDPKEVARTIFENVTNEKLNVSEIVIERV